MRRREIARKTRAALPAKRKNRQIQLLGKRLQLAANALWGRWGVNAGRKDAHQHSIESEENPKKALNSLWMKHAQAGHAERLSLSKYKAAAKGYVQGFCTAKKIPIYNWMLLPTNKSVAAIVSITNEEAAVSHVIDELNRLPLNEIILVINGCEEDTPTKVKEHSHAVIVYHDELMGDDAGRAVGAKSAQSDILLFLDGDLLVPAEQLIPFIRAVEKGMDVALNHISPFLGMFDQRDSLAVMQQFLNTSLGRPDLGADSLTVVPYALSRKAYDTIGDANLLVPPKAHVLAILKGLRVGAPSAVNVFADYKRRKQKADSQHTVALHHIIDHSQAIGQAIELREVRLSFPDTLRKRKFAKAVTQAEK
jgi:hypothetical protein